MKTRIYLSVILVVAAIGIILAFVFLFPSPNAPEAGIGIVYPAPGTSAASAPSRPATPASSASVTRIPLIPPPNAILAPVPVMPPAKQPPQLDDAIRLPRPATNQSPGSGTSSP